MWGKFGILCGNHEFETKRIVHQLYLKREENSSMYIPTRVVVFLAFPEINALTIPISIFRDQKVTRGFHTYISRFLLKKEFGAHACWFWYFINLYCFPQTCAPSNGWPWNKRRRTSLSTSVREVGGSRCTISPHLACKTPLITTQCYTTTRLTFICGTFFTPFLLDQIRPQ